LRVVEMTRVCWALWTNDYTQACFDWKKQIQILQSFEILEKTGILN
jgi:hypothetical protein